MANIVLSAQQEGIIGWFATGRGNLAIRARAGCGKTFTGLAGIDAAPEARILFAAFNKRIADEIKGKLRNPRAEAKTWHGVGYGFCTRNRKGFKVDAARATEDATRAAPGASKGLITQIAKLASLGKNMLPIDANLDNLTDTALDFDIGPSEDDEADGWDLTRVVKAALDAMMYAKEQNPANTLTFDDMIFLPVALGWARPTYDMVVVDEAQDLNRAQALLLNRVVKPSGRVCVVGDDRQAMYAFRGADADSFDNLRTGLNAKEMPLTVTRRCGKAIVALAATIVPDFQAAPDAPEGKVSDSSAEDMFKSAKVGDFILSRKNAPLAHIALRFLRNGQRARIEGKDIGQGLAAMVKKIGGKGFAKLGIAVFLAKLAKYHAKQAAKLQGANGTHMETRLALLQDQVDTIAALAEGCDSTQALVTRIEDLFNVWDKGTPPPAIVCSTVHKAKGLESDTVFVCMDTLYPGGRVCKEEQNIEYVAYTRAISHLVRVTGIA